MLVYLDTLIGFAVVMLGASLMVMLLTQGISAAASLRGSSLHWGIQELFKTIDPRNLPNIAAQADILAQKVLTHNLTSDSIFSSLPWLRKLVPQSWVKRFQLASAIRGDELVGILRHLADDPALAAVSEEIKDLLSRPNPVAERQIRLMTETSAALKKLELDRAPALIAETVKTVRESAGFLEAGFNTAMDRVSQQFATYVRIWTIAFSFVLAGVLGLDSVRLVTDLYSKSDLRSSLVNSAQSMMTVAGNTLPAGAQSSADAVSSAMTSLYTNALKKAVPTADAQGIKTRSEGENWIHNNVPGAQQADAMKAYSAAVDQALEDFLKSRAKDAQDIQAVAKASGLQFAPGWPKGYLYWPQVFGVMLTGALLSLGAPFWFNSLKALTNLRPIIANKQTDEDKATA